MAGFNFFLLHFYYTVKNRSAESVAVAISQPIVLYFLMKHIHILLPVIFKKGIAARPYRRVKIPAKIIR